MHEINELVEFDSNYKKVDFEFSTTDKYQYFKYDNISLPSSKVRTFRIDFSQYSTSLEKYKVYCTNVPSSTSDSDLIEALKTLTSTTSSCIDIYRSFANYDGIAKLDSQKTKLGIVVVSEVGIAFGATLYLRVAERILGTDESKPMEEESYSLVPFTVNISKFREISKSKILFYSYSRVLQMFHVESSNPYPEKLFSGNVLSVYTNPNMIRQKYYNASTMILLVYPYGADANFHNLKEEFKFEVKLFDSNYLLDYYVSSNEGGRPLNSPLLINMTQCTSPYFVILNYNRIENSKTLIIDQIYGKLSYLGVATDFTKSTWDEMLENDLETIDINTRTHTLPDNSKIHLDVYKVECELPLMLNFYYIDENELLPKMNFGDVAIFTLKAYETVNIPFFSGIIAPTIIIEIFNPFDDPIVIVEAQGETVYTKNTLIETTPMTLSEGINIKERGGLSDTRIIIKVGYSQSGWVDITDYMKYNSQYDTYLFEFPNDIKRYNYTLADLITSGTNSDDNVKYCFNTNIGSALKPSSENCYRVSKDNSYTLKVYNPLIMYKDYEYDEGLSYYITFKAVTEASYFNVEAKVSTYDTTIRNFEGINNKIIIDSTGDYSSILTPPKNKDPAIFIQVQICDNINSVKAKIIKPLTGEVLVSETNIEAGTKNFYTTFKNDLIDTEFFITGNKGVEVFIRMVGLPTIYVPSFNNNQQIKFDMTTNTLNVESPITKTESMKYTVLVDREGVLSQKGLTLCSFVGVNIESLALYTKTITTNNKIASIQINFDQAKILPKEKFEAVIYVEQQTKSQMVFLSEIFVGIVGDIDIETINEINEVYTLDTNYVYKEVEATSNQPSYYLSFTPSEILTVPIGAFSIEVEQSVIGSFTGVACTFVDNGRNAMSMIEAVEEAIEKDTSYCLGSQSSVNSRRYNYIFKYEYSDEHTPKTMVIKVSNGNSLNGKFNIYVKKDQGITIERTDFDTLKEYGKDEESKKTVVPYIIDVYDFRGDDYVSKILFYSQHLEMQMYYIPEEANQPIKLFFGNIALVYTKPELAIQKYHATTLILFSENLEGQEHSSLGDTFRFHTKMFRSDSQIEFFVSQNPEGRTLNFPLSVEMNCTSDNNKLYYIVNYNKPEPSRTIHLDMVFGSYLSARIAREINAEKWDLLLSNSMTDIIDYQIDLPEKSQHIDVIEITCSSPLLLNAYYSYEGYPYNNVKEGEIVVKQLQEEQSFSFSVEKGSSSLFFYTMSLFNPNEAPSVTVQFSEGTHHYISENSLQTGMLMSIPERVTIINNSKSKTRFIFKIGYGVEASEDWHIVEEQQNLEGTLFANVNKYVYKFPVEENKRNFTSVTFTVNSINEVENVKFCYSTNLGIAIEASKENCFRTGKNIPYTLTFLNPLIIGKNYRVNTDKYFISFRPFDDKDFINIEISENRYNNLNRNEEGVPRLLTLINGKAGSILSLPEYQELSKLFVQLKSCKSHSDKISYFDYNALTEEYITDGKIYYSDKNGIHFSSPIVYLENEIKLEGESGVTIFSKHAGIDSSYVLSIENYEVTFESNINVATITKPIFNEEFIITVLVGEKDSLISLTQCDLAFKDRKSLAPYVSTFTSISSNIITHYIDFSNSLHFDVGKTFDLLVYAEQTKNTKMEFLYPVITGTVGKISEVENINEFIEGENEYVHKTFSLSSSSNHLFYDFTRKPYGNIASLKIKTVSTKVNKVGCVFVSNTASDEDMINSVNRAVLEGTSVCIGEMQKDNDGYDALINAKYTEGKNRLVIQVLYGLGEEEGKKLKEGEEINLIIKIMGTKLGVNEGKFGGQENYAAIPYVIDLLEIRESKAEYVSKILLYSNTREMEMFYIDDDSYSPVSLFTGNIMLIYTNEELVNQKYHGATTMILITDSLSSIDQSVIGEKYRFMVKYFNSASNINYFLSSNPDGRPLNNPTTIEMTSCNQPYYYIMNYNKVEEQRKLHIDTIFGEKQSIKIATALNYDEWDSLISNMQSFDGDEIILQSQTKYHFDVIEVKCNLPLLLNLFYVNPTSTKVTGLEVGDISILSLEKGQEQQLECKQGLNIIYVYSFNILKGNNQKPNIEITFNGADPLEINENGVFTKYSLGVKDKILVKNKENSGSTNTRIIFKYGYPIEQTFEMIKNGIYSNQNDNSRTANLFGYIHDQTNTKLNFTGVDFEVTTTEDNVKFCYSTNLGTFINPSLQNCYRVGKNNPYTISTLNPLVMFRDYYSEEHMNYYVGFRTVELNQNITIIPKEKRYDTTERNFEGEKNKITIGYEKEYSTILTAPKNNEPFIFTHIHICTKNKPLSYEFLNAYNSSNLGFNGEIQANSKYQFKSVDNTKLDTELKLVADNGVEVFVKHIGISERYQPLVNDIKINYDKKSKLLSWNQPILEEEFQYTIYIDKIGTLKRLGYTLCDIVDVTKLGHFSEVIATDDKNPSFVVPYIGKEYEDFDIIIIAEQVNKGKLTIMSAVYNSNGESYDDGDQGGDSDEKKSGNNIGLIILIIILSVIIIAGAIFALIVYRRYKRKGEINKKNKETSMALIKSTKNEKLVESQAQETNQIDP